MRRLDASILLIVLLALLLWAYIRSNRFPFYYHTDEPEKVDQVIFGAPNYHHPLLLINATDLAVRALNIDKTPQRVVVVGRWVSAIAAMLAVAAVVLIVRRYSGWTFGLLAGLLAGMHPLLFEIAHYMKEDCVLLAGLTWTLYGLDCFSNSQSKRSLGLIGFASGVAISGKYIGVLALGFAVVLVIYKSRRLGRTAVIGNVALLLALCVLTFVVLNLQALLHPGAAVHGLGSEFEKMNTGRKFLFFQTNYFGQLIAHAGPLLLLGTVAYLATFLVYRDRKKTIEWVLVVFAIAYLTLICVPPFQRERYLVPVITLLSIFAVWGVCSVANWIGDNRPAVPRLTVGIFGCAVLLAGELPLTFLCEREFARDVRTEMVKWIRDHLPTDAVIAYEQHLWPSLDPQDWRTQLPQRRVLLQLFFPTELNNIDKMRWRGVTHVIGASWGYLRHFEREDIPTASRIEFYKDLEKNGIVLWQFQHGRIDYLSPEGLTVYALPNPSATHDVRP